MKILKYIIVAISLIFLTFQIIKYKKEKAIILNSEQKALEAVLYFKNKSIENTKSSEYQKSLINQKNQEINELKMTKNRLSNQVKSSEQKRRALEEAINTQILTIEQKQNEILILKKELLEHISTP
jgi:hypothetical protein